ncbi:hypothetical protein ABQF78_008185 [Xanthomonas campestris]|uniref:hypothetical protein n=1 Tax=Xanthomonas campestris TaxID=339 RepID=UPI002B22AC06|nr:hypothetical protein [Xanthomonas campestris]MEA9644477.1 hypothetical protein [Xanthomonas campestris]MEA9697065.1 hypothetical protein [Xanthomonas campestris]
MDRFSDAHQGESPPLAWQAERGVTVIRIVTRADAIRPGLSRYLTGKPCKRGHIAERRTRQGDCTDCN